MENQKRVSWIELWSTVPCSGNIAFNQKTKSETSSSLQTQCPSQPVKKSNVPTKIEIQERTHTHTHTTDPGLLDPTLRCLPVAVAAAQFKLRWIQNGVTSSTSTWSKPGQMVCSGAISSTCKLENFSVPFEHIYIPVSMMTDTFDCLMKLMKTAWTHYWFWRCGLWWRQSKVGHRNFPSVFTLSITTDILIQLKFNRSWTLQ